MEDTVREAQTRPCRIKAFFQREHTPAEKGAMVAAALLAGVAVGVLLAPVSGGIHLEVSLGSHNGCYNKGCGSKNKSKTSRKKQPK